MTLGQALSILSQFKIQTLEILLEDGMNSVRISGSTAELLTFYQNQIQHFNYNAFEESLVIYIA